MRKAALLFNARSGGRTNHREADLLKVLSILGEAGIESSLVRTTSNADATEQARKAIVDGYDTIFACGGDGTINDVLQAMAGSRVALGVIPMGTANALAHDLGLPMLPANAVRAALSAEARRVAVGRVTVRGLDGDPVTRYFTVAAGVGVDAHLFYKLHTGMKQRLGIGAYYAKAWHLWFTHRMARFQVAVGSGADMVSRDGVTEMLAVRIRHFGGMVQELAPGASLDRDDVRVVVCTTSNRLTYLLYVARGLVHSRWSVPGVELFHAGQVRCDLPSSAVPSDSAQENTRIYVEADGELIGTLPAEITMVPDALTVLSARRK